MWKYLKKKKLNFLQRHCQSGLCSGGEVGGGVKAWLQKYAVQFYRKTKGPEILYSGVVYHIILDS